MSIGLDIINGVSVGIEFIPGADENTVIIDCLVIRLLLQW